MKNETERLERAILKIGGPEIAATVLEAAGKVDKDRALRVLATLLQRYVMGMGTMPELERDLADGAARQIRALLEALPDEEPTVAASRKVKEEGR